MKDISELQILQLKNDMRNCIIEIIVIFILKIQVSCLDPIVALDWKIALKRLTSCLEVLVSSGKMSSVKADHVK